MLCETAQLDFMHHFVSECYYHNSRTHISLEKDSPESRAVQSNEAESIIQLPQVGGLIIDTSASLHEQDFVQQSSLYCSP
jgi:hypothetical protein